MLRADEIRSKSGWAPVKKEYLVVRKAVKKEEGDDDGEKSADPSSPPPKKRKGMNKRRSKNAQKRDFSKTLCPSILSPEKVCTFGEKCLFSHDKHQFWENRPTDIAAECPNFESKGYCRFGLTCRYAGSHVDAETLENKRKDTATSDSNTTVSSSDLPRLLRQKHVDFSKANTVIKDVEKGTEFVALEGPEMEKRSLRVKDFLNKPYLAPLTTVGNLPFRRICVELGAEITCGEMALATSLLQGKQSEWSLVKRHESERFFGVQICGSHVDSMTKCAQILSEKAEIDFIDINLGCPIDLICNKGAGCALMNRVARLDSILKGVDGILRPLDIPLTVKMRAGLEQGKNTAIKVIEKIKHAGPSLFTIHGRSKEQRYAKLADWSYVNECANTAAPFPLLGCGDVFSYHDYYNRLNSDDSAISGIMIGRAALYKPWIFTEIEERRDWDITANERLDILKKFVHNGLDHWGSDNKGVETTRRFLLEWLSFLNRYIPVGLLEVVPQHLNEKPPMYFGRNELETLMASERSTDWVKITELLLGPVPDDFVFLPKHKANAY